jgi:hypothetical protein
MEGLFGVVMTVCLTVGGQCKDVQLAGREEPITPNQCMMVAMPEMAKWIADHDKEGWEIKGWSCGRITELKASI